MENNHTYFYPAIKDKSNFLFKFVFDIEEFEVKVERNIVNDSVAVYSNGVEISVLTKKAAKKESIISIKNHKITIKNKVEKNPILLLLGAEDGLSIFVDGRPLEKSLADPSTKINKSIYALAIFAVLGFFTLLFTKSIYAGAIGTILILLSFGTKRIAVLALALGTIFAIVEIIFTVSHLSATNGSVTTIQTLFIAFKIGLTVMIIRGFIAAIKLSSFKKLQ